MSSDPPSPRGPLPGSGLDDEGSLALHLPEWRTPALGAIAGALVLAGAIADEAWLWAAVIALQVAIVVTWHRSLDAPSAASGAVVGGGLAAIVDVVVAVTENEPSLGPIAVVLGAGYLVAVVQQLARRDGRDHLVDALAATVSLGTIAALGAAWVVLWQLPDGEDTVVVLAGAVVAAAVGRLAPGLAGALIGPLAAGIVAGAQLGASVDDVGHGLGLGLAAGIPASLAAAMQAQVRGS
ncbi:MAG: hypothetical protein ACJ74E_09605, partial [Actinomycetes bacterium]